MKSEKKPLVRQLKMTVFALSTAMLAVWFLFYVNMNHIIKSYVMDNMKQISTQIISELNRTFLQMEEMSFVLSENESVADFVNAKSSLEFHTKAAKVEQLLEQMSGDTTFMDNVIFYSEEERFYRFNGNISNTGIKRMMNIIKGGDGTKHIQIKLDDTNYIGYVTSIKHDEECLGKIAMLTNENDIHRLFLQLAKDEDMKIALAADSRVIISTKEEMIGKTTAELTGESAYLLHEQVGFTPFELLISYEDTEHEMSHLFFVAMVFMAVILLLMLEVFLHFWKKKFFAPIQTVISEVEAFESGKGEMLSLTGVEHFDGLVMGINEMIKRIEEKEKEIYEATASLQKAEIKKQKALIVSLKKQISAHFTVNVLNVIKALSANGDNEKAGLLCDGLAFLLRYANAGDSYISGMDEFFVLERYIDIMEIRYPNRFTAEIDVEDFLEEIEIPRMLLQPIVENSILHGLGSHTVREKGMIHVYCIREQKQIRIIVEDNGSGMGEKQLTMLKDSISHANEEAPVEGLSHVALVNIQRRIQSYFGAGYGLVLESDEGKGTKVIMTLPIRWRKL